MKEQWKEGLDNIPYPDIDQGRVYKEQVSMFIEELLEEQKMLQASKSYTQGYEQAKKDIINQLLQGAPEDVPPRKEWEDGFNQCNALWKENLSKLRDTN